MKRLFILLSAAAAIFGQVACSSSAGVAVGDTNHPHGAAVVTHADKHGVGVGAGAQ